MYPDRIEGDLAQDQLDYVYAVLEDGGEWGDPDPANGGQAVFTREAGAYDCSGRFKIDLYGNSLGVFYSNPDLFSVDLNCGDVPEGEYDLDDLVYSAGTCPECGNYVGVDNMEQVWFAGRACTDCAPAKHDEFQRYIDRYGTD